MTSSVNVTARLIPRFILDLVVSGGRLVEGDFDAGLLLLAIAQANVEVIADDALKPARDDAAAIPDALKRPISAHALAATLALPRETVRRQVNKLIAVGGCVRVGYAGLVVPAAFYRQPAMLAFQAEILSSFSALMDRLDALGVCWLDDADQEKLAPGRSAALVGRLPTVSASRLITAFALRVFSAWIHTLGGLPTQMLVMAIHDANTSHLDVETSLRFATSDSVIPDSLRVPVPLSLLADRLPISRSTTYRIAKRMIDEGTAKRVGSGLIVTREWYSSEPQRSLTARMHKDFLKLLAQLSTLAITEAGLAEHPAGDPLP